MKVSMAKMLDASAMGLSALCMVHCLALPALALVLPFLGFWARAEWVHVVFILIAAPIAVLAFVDVRTMRPHGWPLAIAAAFGLALMLAGALELPRTTFERPLTVLGGLVLARAHLANWRRRHNDDHHA